MHLHTSFRAQVTGNVARVFVSQEFSNPSGPTCLRPRLQTLRRIAPGFPLQRGNSVIEGHRDTHFNILKQLRLGDRLDIELPDGRSVAFVVADLRVADTRKARISLGSQMPRLTLVTCYPFDALQPGGPLRYVVTADWVMSGPSR
jgi:LPXTG-site transpeptidase (sortase) family protein